MRLIKIATFICGFGVARASLFLAPILLANLVSTQTYGMLELAQAMGAVLALLFGLGLQGSIPLVLLRSEVLARWDTLLWLISRIAASCLVVAVVLGVTRGNAVDLWVLVPLATAVLLLQGLWSITLKSREQSTRAVFLETGFWMVALLGAYMAFAGGLGLMVINGALAVYACLLLAVTWRVMRGVMAPFTRTDLGANIKIGLPLMFTGILSLLVASSGRLVLGGTASVAEVGVYAILYRGTALPLVAHQILIVGLFRKLFIWDIPVLQRRAPVIVFGVTFCALGFWALEDVFTVLLGQKFADTLAQFRFTGYIILFQTILWSAIALNDLLVARLQIAGRVVYATASYIGVTLPLLAFHTWQSNTPFETFAQGYAAVMLGYYCTQCLAIWWQGHWYPRLWFSTLGCFVVCVFGTYYLYGTA